MMSLQCAGVKRKLQSILQGKITPVYIGPTVTTSGNNDRQAGHICFVDFFVAIDMEKCAICHQPEGPNEDWVQCTLCKQWYHCTCVGISVVEAENLFKWLCKDCTH